MKFIIPILAILFTSCAGEIPLPGGTRANVTFGFFSPSSAEEGGRLGAFTEIADSGK